MHAASGRRGSSAPKHYLSSHKNKRFLRETSKKKSAGSPPTGRGPSPENKDREGRKGGFKTTSTLNMPAPWRQGEDKTPGAMRCIISHCGKKSPKKRLREEPPGGLRNQRGSA